MKRIPAKDLQTNVDAVLDSAQSDRVVISRRGKPCAVLVGIEDYDAEDLRLASSNEFWSMVRQRRTSGRSVPLEEVEARLEKRGAGRAKKQSEAKKR
ncbi:MAG TPA: type II toxin-antitoxin system Phd/YefM family antitoxin [Pirellulales bacterium]|nr:type II toxin-antitoxin system Phd/YefM family antitoxin [Pirellulales bacterium]